jgi:ATP-dependent RNA helicase MSS116, mitochondrial
MGRGNKQKFYHRGAGMPANPLKTNRPALETDEGFSGTSTPSDLPPPSIEVPVDTPRFEDLREKKLLNSTVLDTLTNDLGFDHMMPVQAATLEYLLQGNDCMAQAKTGTGKTLAFLLPAIDTILRGNSKSQISALIICPTRELALQIATEANKVLQRLPHCRVATAIGGTNKDKEQRVILGGCNILVATPGRLLDHLSEEEVQFRLGSLQTLVLDEADRMVDMGFLPSIKQILTYLPKNQPRQTMLFSATIDEQVKNVAHLFLNKDHRFISTIPEGEAATHEQVDQYLVTAATMSELAPAAVAAIKAELAVATQFKAIVFAPTAVQAKFYDHLLSSDTTLPKVTILHSRMTQNARTKATNEFRQAANGICVATDVIARGIDFPGVTHVFQVGLPMDRESYIHRLGRTARAGASGRGILVLADLERNFVHQLKGIVIQPYPKTLEYNMKDIEDALPTLENKDKVYQGWLGYYKTFAKALKLSPAQLVQEANQFALTGMQCPEVPALEKRTIGKMGLKGVPGLKVLPNAPGSNDPRRQGGGEGRNQGRPAKRNIAMMS